MGVIIILDDCYPNGRACTNRIHLYAKGLIESGTNVKIFIHKPSELPSQKLLNRFPAGYYKGVYYLYTSGTTRRSRSLLTRWYYDIKGIIKAGYKLIKYRHSTEAVILVSDKIPQILYYKFITSLFRIAYINEQGEPANLDNNGKDGSGYHSNYYKKFVKKMFDGIIVVSKQLEEYYRGNKKKKCQTLYMPAMIDVDEFNAEKSKSEGLFVIASAGSSNLNNSGILTTIKSMDILLKESIPVVLYILGAPSTKKDEKTVRALVKKLGVQDRVIFLGKLTRHEYIEYLCQADLLLLAKPSSEVQGDLFPSVLAEYLAAGKPVLTASYGEIPNVILNGFNGYLIQSDDENDIALKIKYIINNSEEAKNAGLEGRQTAVTNFHYKVNIQKLDSYIRSLAKTKKIKNNIQTSVIVIKR